MSAKLLGKYKTIPTRVPLETLPVLERYLATRFLSYNALVNQLLYERLFGLDDKAAARDASKPVTKPKPQRPGTNASGAEIYEYWHHEKITPAEDSAFMHWINEPAQAEAIARYEAYRAEIGNPVDYTMPAAPITTQPVPPPDDLDLSDIDFSDD